MKNTGYKIFIILVFAFVGTICRDVILGDQ